MTAQRTRVDFAHQMKSLCDELDPEAEVIRVVLDNLNTHSPASLYAAFPAEEARRLTARLEFHLVICPDLMATPGARRSGLR